MSIVHPRVRAPELRGAGGWINVVAPLSLAELRGTVVPLDLWTSCLGGLCRPDQGYSDSDPRLG